MQKYEHLVELRIVAMVQVAVKVAVKVGTVEEKVRQVQMIIQTEGGALKRAGAGGDCQTK